MAEEYKYIQAGDILAYSFYTYGQPFCGSYKGMKFRIKMEKRELPLPEDAKEGDKPPVEKVFTVAVWPQPLCYEAADKETMLKTEYPFSEESYYAIVSYLNEQVPNYHLPERMV